MLGVSTSHIGVGAHEEPGNLAKEALIIKPEVLCSTHLKIFKLHTVYWTFSCCFEGNKTFIYYYNLLARWLNSSLSQSLSFCQASGNHSGRLFQEAIQDFECKTNDQALGAVLRHSFGRLDGPGASAEQKQWQRAFTCGSNRFSLWPTTGHCHT